MLLSTIEELCELAPMPHLCSKAKADQVWRQRDSVQELYNLKRKQDYEIKSVLKFFIGTQW